MYYSIFIDAPCMTYVRIDLTTYLLRIFLTNGSVPRLSCTQDVAFGVELRPYGTCFTSTFTINHVVNCNREIATSKLLTITSGVLCFLLARTRHMVAASGGLDRICKLKRSRLRRSWILKSERFLQLRHSVQNRLHLLHK